jgi:hypothetical protein
MTTHSRLALAGFTLSVLIGIPAASRMLARQISNPAYVDTTGWKAKEDRQNMMDQLGIKALRPGPSGNENDANHANYDEATANPYPDLPEVLTLKNGKKVTTPEMWWNQRRPEIVEDFDREVLGRVPNNVPKVTWTVTKTVTGTVGPLYCGRKAAGGPCRQLRISGNLSRHPDDSGHTCRCQNSCSGHDDVWRRRSASSRR